MSQKVIVEFKNEEKFEINVLPLVIKIIERDNHNPMSPEFSKRMCDLLSDTEELLKNISKLPWVEILPHIDICNDKFICKNNGVCYCMEWKRGNFNLSINY